MTGLVSFAALVVYLSEVGELQVREWEMQAKRLFLAAALRGVEKPAHSKLEALVSYILRKRYVDLEATSVH